MMRPMRVVSIAAEGDEPLRVRLETHLASYMSEDISWRATNVLRADLTLHCLTLDMSFHKAHTPGALIERIDGDIALLSNFSSHFVFSVFGRVLLLIGIVVLTFSVDWHVGLLLLAFVGPVIMLLRPLQGVAVPHFRVERHNCCLSPASSCKIQLLSSLTRLLLVSIR